MTQYSILINTCDKFEDCWDPFFKLFKLYWPDCKGKIYLNTEYKDYSYPGLDIIAIKCCKRHHIPHSKQATWSQCLKWALEETNTDIILYMQEDYFLNAPANNVLFTELLDLFAHNTDMHCLQISPSTDGSDGSTKYKHIDIIKRTYRYRIGCQTALWKRNVLYSYIKEKESAWDFEEFASERAHYIPHNFYIINRQWLNTNPIIPYLATGIIQGRWWEPVVNLFKDHGIVVDFSKRGFVGEAKSKPFLKRIKHRFYKTFKLMTHYPELIYLHWKYKNASIDKPISSTHE